MQTVTSADGTTIAYDRTGAGPVVILIAGAMGHRKFKKMEELAAALAPRCTVINYDRRGRGDSTEATPFDHATALGREIEDLRALIDAEGGRTTLWGWSSGGALALRAAMAMPERVERVAVYEIPFIVDPEAERPTPDYAERLDELVAAGRSSAAVSHFMRNAIGIPAPFVAFTRLTPMWKGLKANAHTLPYDWEALGAHTMYGAPLDPEEFARATMPVLIGYGGKTMPILRQGSLALADVLPNVELYKFPKASHNLPVGRVAALVTQFVSGARTAAPQPDDATLAAVN